MTATEHSNEMTWHDSEADHPGRSEDPPAGRPADLSDAELVALLKHAPDDGVRLLLSQYGAKVMGALLKVFGEQNRPVAEDALSEASYRICQKIDHFDPTRGMLQSYFARIAHNAAIDSLRKRTISGFDRLIAPEHLGALHTKHLAEQTATPKSPFLGDLMRAVAQLSPLQQDIVIADLQAGDRAPAHQLAARFNTTKRSIYSNRSKAMKKLQKLLAQAGHGPGNAAHAGNAEA